MKRLTYAILIASLLLIHASAFGQARAVRIDALSDGRGIDSAALQTARQVVGGAIARGTVDTFIVHSPKAGGPIPIEGGLSACAEAGFTSNAEEFDTFVAQLRSIRPKPGTTISVQVVTSCEEEPDPLACGGFAGIHCPDSSVCIDDPRDSCDPANGGADCSGICVPGSSQGS